MPLSPISLVPASYLNICFPHHFWNCANSHFFFVPFFLFYFGVSSLFFLTLGNCSLFFSTSLKKYSHCGLLPFSSLLLHQINVHCVSAGVRSASTGVCIPFCTLLNGMFCFFYLRLHEARNNYWNPSQDWMKAKLRHSWVFCYTWSKLLTPRFTPRLVCSESVLDESAVLECTKRVGHVGPLFPVVSGPGNCGRVWSGASYEEGSKAAACSAQSGSFHWLKLTGVLWSGAVCSALCSSAAPRADYGRCH